MIDLTFFAVMYLIGMLVSFGGTYVFNRDELGKIFGAFVSVFIALIWFIWVPFWISYRGMKFFFD